MRGVHPKVYWKVTDTLILPCYTVCLILYLLHDGKKVHEFLPLCMQEFPILHRPIDQLQNERSSCHNARATGKKISAMIEKL